MIEITLHARTFRANGPRLTWSPFGIYDWLDVVGLNGARGNIRALTIAQDDLQIDSYAGTFVLKGLAGDPFHDWRLELIHRPDYIGLSVDGQ